MKKYWISTTQWSLIDSMATESISPYSFYGRRCFGSDLSRYVSGSERMNHIILMDTEPSSDYAIEVDEAILDMKALVRAGKRSHLYTYPKSIHFRKGHARFRFSTEIMMKSFLSEAEIMLEVKCTDLYKDDFFVGSGKGTIPSSAGMDCLALESQDESVQREDAGNYMKGAVIGFARGLATSRNTEDSALIQLLTDIRNAVGGIHTRIMIDDTFMPGKDLLSKVDEAEALYSAAGHGTSRGFGVLRHLFIEFVDIAVMRSKELTRRRAPGRERRIADLRVREAECERSIAAIEYTSGIRAIRAELEAIKEMEAKMGEAEGKKRRYFPKDSPEYARKCELKQSIQAFEKDNSQLRETRTLLVRIKDEMASLSSETTEYDGALGPIATKISDAVTGILDTVRKGSTPVDMDMGTLSVSGESLRVACPEGTTKAEEEFFGYVFSDILANPITQLRHVSDADVMEILKRSCKAYVSTGATFGSEDGHRIREVMLSLLYFKMHDPRGKVIIPEGMPLLSAMIPFFVKCQDYAQIERFMDKRGIAHKEYPLLMWSALVGFASLPRTMTSALYMDRDGYARVEEKILEICG